MSGYRRLVDPAVLTLIVSLVVGSLWLSTHQHDSDFGAGFVLGLIAGGSLAFMVLGSRRECS
jgi:ABC-type cobalamin transport system permease subunit